MSSKSTIKISRQKRGTTLRLTGSAAQNFFDALTKSLADEDMPESNVTAPNKSTEAESNPD
ncbi:hypothetical protein [Iodobacter sp. BJB302]|uniref:hypothetical protein n=1 Tax=Iodobacter sp. BJB302 TaxID=1506510 RepID=UPI000C105CE3|nr:hypothetical protein [Iodobacter sp. BJB302]PHV02823.1 hypothetical protein CSQ88_05270 [Iodobacter sp. BJB302]